MINKLWEIIRTLRAPDGCPWDREQTPQSVKKYLLEETCELLDAIDSGSSHEVKEELGDLLFMLLFLAFMYEEQEEGFLEGAVSHVRDKMIRRHPHIFGVTTVSSANEVKQNWQAIKAEEAKSKGKRPSVLGEIPRSLPSLQRAYRLGERASRVGFDWKDVKGVMEKFEEERLEFEKALATANRDHVEEELGDILFTIANLARHLGINPEEALFKTTRRFEDRFKRMEDEFRKKDIDLEDADIELMDEVWARVKKD
ncbi:Nucleoside triphosphate pyrophosphohydrolase MazG [Dissulfuribacter thermophilus]|uniref:Nucleoside triphosphate pyrophosphohydrolase MazG n=1 Tax=Dissulfuribacter thermophilus TaxID=1156395 RepID=A0A1B9F345_9BACT|nr:nucleoside triphosphate pyrophosphohydrolase [Dissulfuribacter thermophilus]OCC14342.1 Nucleoside triphosphate pyrophosphohydrolase MazG [Dissulfuribacter thermophilus]